MLTTREKDFCENFVKYKGNDKEMIKAMTISHTTLTTHRNHVYEKLDVHNKWELMHYLLT